jgi:hypothetical protein
MLSCPQSNLLLMAWSLFFYRTPSRKLLPVTTGPAARRYGRTHGNQEINDMLLGYVTLPSCQGMDKVNEGHRR